MYPTKRLDGSTTYHIMDFKISATVIIDQAVIASAAGADGGELTDATTTSLLDFVGSVLGASSRDPHSGDSGSLTYSTTQNDSEGLVRVYITPDIVYRALMSGGAAAGTALQTVTNNTASAGGTLITAADTPENAMDDGLTWCLSGGNPGHSRKITAFTANVSATVTVPFKRAIAVNDTFAVIPYLPLTTRAVQLGTLLTQADATIAVGTGGNATVVEVVLNGVSDSYVHFIARDSVFNELS